MRILLIRAGLLGIVLAAAAAPARADATLFGGVATSATGSTSGPAFGVAFGRCPGILGFELEYAGGPGGSGAQTVAVNALVQTTLPIHRMQFYGIGGVGVYGETGSGEIASGDFGAGAKITLGGPLKVRVDYRVFLLGASPDAAAGLVIRRHPQRFSAGLSVAF